MTTAEQTLVVPAGASLANGQLYLRLYHGRLDPKEDMEEWGFQGPVFGPLSSVVLTYFSTIRIYGTNDTDEVWIDTQKDMVMWEGKYYGDFEIFLARPRSTA